MKKKNLLLVLFFPIVLFADYSWERSPAGHMVNDGIHALYNYQFEFAITILDSAWELDDKHPLIPFLLISVKWLILSLISQLLCPLVRNIYKCNSFKGFRMQF